MNIDIRKKNKNFISNNRRQNGGRNSYSASATTTTDICIPFTGDSGLCVLLRTLHDLRALALYWIADWIWVVCACIWCWCHRRCTFVIIHETLWCGWEFDSRITSVVVMTDVVAGGGAGQMCGLHVRVHHL